MRKPSWKKHFDIKLRPETETNDEALIVTDSYFINGQLVTLFLIDNEFVVGYSHEELGDTPVGFTYLKID